METYQEKPLSKKFNTESFPMKNQYEKLAWERNSTIAGIDEVGRGCTAGPVIAVAALLHPHAHHELLKDSKKLSKKELSLMYDWLTEHSWYGVGICNHHMIDTINIYQATQYAMKRAYAQLSATCPHTIEQLLIDAMPLKGKTLPSNIISYPKGEDWSCSIAAASILAKVIRDRIMSTMDNTIYKYSFSQHKGYSSVAHQEALKKYGPSFIHRTTFIHTPCNHEQQQTLFC